MPAWLATLGEAHDQGWRVTIYCTWGKRELKSIRECTARVDADLPTMLWTHGREYPLARLDGRLKCPRCGSRRVLAAFSPPANEGKATARAER